MKSFFSAFRISSLSLLACLLLLSGCSLLGGGGGEGIAVGSKAPYTRFTLLDGSLITTQNLAGKPTVISFWASTCTRAPKAIERLNKSASPRYRLIAVNLDKSDMESDVRAMIQHREMGNFEHAFSGNAEYDEAYMAYRGRMLPYFIVIDAAGIVRYSGNDIGDVEDLLVQVG